MRGIELYLKATLALLLVVLPVAAESWDIQFAEPFDFTRNVTMLDLDGEFTEASDVAALKVRGVEVICYVAVGTWENYRGDAEAFPEEILGKIWPDWPDERYIDIRQLDILMPLMQARFQTCKDKGFDGIEGDNQDLHWADTGFPIERADQVAYSQALANMAHEMGLAYGQKNSPDLVPELIDHVDFIITEDCFKDGWCSEVLPFIQAGKPVYAIEYTDTGVDFAAACVWGAGQSVSFILKARDLNGTTYKDCE